MSVRYDPLLAEALGGEIADRWSGTRVLGLGMDRRSRALALWFDDAPCLVALLHPEAGFLLPTERCGLETAEAFRRLFLGVPEIPADERLCFLPVVDGRGRERHRLVLELHTNQWNAALLDPAADRSDAPRIRRVLWPRDLPGRRLAVGEPYRMPPGRRAGADAAPPVEEWIETLGPIPPGERRRTALRSFAYLSAINVDHVLGDASRSTASSALHAAYERYLGIRAAGGRFLLELRWGLQPYVADLDGVDARPAPSLLAGMRIAADEAGGMDRFLEADRRLEGAPASARPAEPGAAALRRALLARRDRLRRRRSALRRELAEGEDPEMLRGIGNLLLARLRDVPRGASQVELSDFGGGTRQIALDPALDPAANAEAYFDRAGRRARALKRVPEEIERVDGALARLASGLEELEASGPSDALWELAGGAPTDDEDRGPDEEGRPYLRLCSSGGLEIRVGRSARTNDDLTFHHSSPSDIWLHARQVKGAHVILRWPEREANPPRRDLLEAAVAAAVHSGARHAGTAAVDWTRRKYVRKPRKAPAGAVVPDRVKTLFVEPDERLVARLRARAEEPS